MSMKLQNKKYEGRHLMDKMESLAREGYFFKENTEQKQYGMDIMWYLWTGKCSSLFGKDTMTTFERYFIEEKETHNECKNTYFNIRENEEIPIKANGKIIVIDGSFSKAYQNKTGIAGYTLIYNSHSLQLVSHEPFTYTEDAIVNKKDILSTIEVVEHKVNRKRVRDTDIGKRMEE